VQKNEDSGRYAGAGLGLGFRLLGMDSGFNSLDANSVARAYRTAKSRLILLDYGGTILANDNVSWFLSLFIIFIQIEDLMLSYCYVFSWMVCIGFSL